MPKEKKRKSEKKSKPRTIANRRASANQPESPSTPETSASDFPVVGIGASAGGLEAFFQLLNSLPDDLDMGFVFIQHLDPKHESKLSELISRVTKMSVSQVRDADVVRPNHIYIIPP